LWVVSPVIQSSDCTHPTDE